MIATNYNDVFILTGSCLAIFDGKTYAVIGVEITMPTLAADLAQYTWQIIIADAIVLAVLIVIFVILFNKLLIRPL